jgi:hypothetical protein
VLACIYLIFNVAISSVKIYSTVYIVFNTYAPDYYKYNTFIPGMVLGQVIDIIWFICNAIIPIFIAYIRMINEKPLTVNFSVPIPFYGGDEPEADELEAEDMEPTEATSLLQPAKEPAKTASEEPAKTSPIEPTETTPIEPAKTTPNEPAKTAGPIPLGTYKIKTTAHEASGCAAGWGLSAWRRPSDGVRNSVSTWVAAHAGDVWPCLWEIKPGREKGTYQVVSKPHAKSQHPGEWGLSAFPAHGAKRNDFSTKVAVHEGTTWPMDWKIVPGRTEGTYWIVTTEHVDAGQKAGCGLSAWGPKVKDTTRNTESSWVHVHEGNVWPMDWVFEKQEYSEPRIPLGTYNIKTTVHEKSGCVAGWGLSAWRRPSDGVRNVASTWVAAHAGDDWPCQWEIKKGRKEGTYRIETKPHAKSKHPGGWGLSVIPIHGAKRNDWSTKVAVHEGTTWPMDWRIVPGRTEGTYWFVTTDHFDGGQEPGWALSAWGPKIKDTIRNSASSWVHVHDGTDWPMDWILEKEEEKPPSAPQVSIDINSGTHYIQSVSSKNYLNGRNSNPQNNQVYLSNDSKDVAYPNCFKWTFEKVGTMYMIKSLTSGKYLDGRNPQHIGKYGAVLVTAFTPGYNDMYLLWTVEKVDGNYSLKSKSSGAYLDGRNPEHTGAQVLLTNRPPNGDSYLQWVIKPKP